MSDENKDKQPHGGNGWFWDNLGMGWRMDCLCGYVTPPDIALSVCGEDMDEHLYVTSRERV